MQNKKLPIIPDANRLFTVVEYPSNAKTEELVRLILRSAGYDRETKEGLIAQYDSFTEEDISQEISYKDTEVQIARHVVKEDLPTGVSWDDLSSNALREAVDAFFGIDDAMRDALAQL